MGGPLKKFVTPWRFLRLIRGYCSIGRGQKYVVFLKIIIRIQGAERKRDSAQPQEKEIVTQAELTCKELTELITDYLEERLPQTERARLEQHLSVCPGCVTYLDQMRLTIKALGGKPRVEIPKAIESDLLLAFRRWKNSR